MSSRLGGGPSAEGQVKESWQKDAINGLETELVAERRDGRESLEGLSMVGGMEGVSNQKQLQSK